MKGGEHPCHIVPRKSNTPLVYSDTFPLKLSQIYCQCLRAKCQNVCKFIRELKPLHSMVEICSYTKHAAEHKIMACILPILSRMLGYRKYPSKCHNSGCTTSVYLLLLDKDHCVHYANSISAHDRLKTDLMKGLKRISRVLMNMVGWTMYRALMFFLYLKTRKKRTLSLCHFFIIAV